MKDKRQIIPAAGLVAVLGAAAYMVVQLGAQTPAITGDFTRAAQAEVRDAQGQVILRGAFQLVEEEDDDVERKASLAATGIDADAAGEAEVEFSKAASTAQEVEFSVHNVQPGATFTFVIDGVEVGSATADAKGRAELEVDVRMK